MSIGRIAVLALTAVFVVGAFSAAFGGLFDGNEPASAGAGIDLRKDDANDDELVTDADEDRDRDGDSTRGNDGTRGGDNTGDGDATAGNDGTRGGDNSYAPPPAPAPAGGGDFSASGGGSDG